MNPTLSIVTSNPKSLAATLEAQGFMLVELLEKTKTGEKLLWRHQAYKSLSEHDRLARGS
jgi:hypothetical protein